MSDERGRRGVERTNPTSEREGVRDYDNRER